MQLPAGEFDPPTILATMEAAWSAPSAEMRSAALEELSKLRTSVDQATGYVPAVMSLCMHPEVKSESQQLGATQFKNLIRDCWNTSSSEHVLNDVDKQHVRDGLFSLVMGGDPTVSRLAQEALTVVAKADFPHLYPTVLDEILAVIDSVLPGGETQQLQNPEAVEALSRAMEASLAIFERYKSLGELTEETKEELLGINRVTALPLTVTMEAAREAAADALQQGKADAAKAYITLLHRAIDVLFCLTATDLGQEHVDVMQRLVNTLKDTLGLQVPVDGSLLNPTVIIDVHASALDVLSMYLQRYDEEMEMYADGILRIVWDSMCSELCKLPEADRLVVASLDFFERTLRSAQSELVKAALPSLVGQVLVPALGLSDEDQDEFAWEPAKYIQRDIEGSDFQTRRHAGARTIRTALSVFPDQVSLFLDQLQRVMQQGTWQDVHVAIALVGAIALKFDVAGKGAVQLSGLFDDLQGFYAQFIGPQLASGVDGADPKADVGPFVLKADSLRFIATFRYQLPPQALLELLPCVAEFLSAEQQVVHTYAAHTIERILSMINPETNTPLFTVADVAPMAATVAKGLCDRLSTDRVLNEYIPRCLAQLLKCAPNACQPFGGDVLVVLVQALDMAAKNPSNPLYCHFLFESVGYTLQLLDDPMQVVAATEALCEPIFRILGEDVWELIPYALQVLAALLDAQPCKSLSPSAPTSATPSAAAGIPSTFLPLFEPLCSPALFEKKGNIPAAVRLITAFVRRDAAQLDSAGHTPRLLERADMLIRSRLEDHHGFEIFGAFAQHYPKPVLNQHMSHVFKSLFNRMQQRPTAKYRRMLALFLSALVAKHGAAYFETLLSQVQEGMTVLVLKQIMLPVIAKVTGQLERKICAVGLTNLLQDSEAVWNAEQGVLWAVCVEKCLSLLHLAAEADLEADAMLVAPEQRVAVSDLQAEVEETAVGSRFIQLASIVRPPEDPCEAITDPQAYFKVAIKAAAAQRPDATYGLLQANLPEGAFGALEGYFA